MLTFDKLYNEAVIKKEYIKNDIKYLQLTYYDETSNKLAVITISYKRYLLQQYLGYLLPKEYKIVHLDNDITNFNIYNLGIRDMLDESPIYKEWTVSLPFRHSEKRADICINLNKNKAYKQLAYHYYLMTNYLGRRLLEDEKVHFIKSSDKKYDLKNLYVKRLPQLQSKLYVGCDYIRGPIATSKRLHVIIYFLDGTHVSIGYPRFIMQEHLGRFLSEDETIHHKDGDYYNNEITNLEILSWSDHSINDTWRLKPVTLVCQICQQTFSINRRRLSNAYSKFRIDPSMVGPFCSRKCYSKVNQYTKHLYKQILPEKRYCTNSGLST